MTQRFIQVPVWLFEEADEKLREKILEKQRDFNTDYDWYEFVYEDWKEKLEALGYMKPDINFSGFWSQGDGASFTCEYLNSPEIKERFLTDEEKAILTDCKIYGKVERISHRYSHENTVRANISDVDYSTAIYDLEAEDYEKYISIVNKIDAIISDLEKEMTEDVRNLSRQIYRELEKEYEYQTSDEAVAESLISNGYLFNEFGVIAGNVGDEDEQE